jgi:apolipoprotein N-acyltransferase
MRFPERHRYPVALIAGMAVGLAFPLPGYSALAMIGPGLFLVAGIGLSPLQAFRLGYAGGLVLFLTSLRWLLDIPVLAGAVAAWLALSAYCALYPALWVLFATWLSGATSQSSQHTPVIESNAASRPAALSAWKHSLVQWVRWSWWVRFRWILGSAAAWVLLEMVRGWLLGGFPWNLLGSAFYKTLPLLQLAAWTGIYGLSFLGVWASLSLMSAALAILFRSESRWSWTGELRIPILFLLVLGAMGVRRFMTPHEGRGSIRVVLIQPSIPQTLIWDAEAATNRFEQILELSRQALREPAEVLVWPEGSLPGIGRNEYDRMLELTRSKGVQWILGGDETERTDAGVQVYNSAFLVGKSGVLESTYRKRRLVIFGEYVPFERALPFLRHLTPIGGSFSEGGQVVLFELAGGKGRAAPVICFEDVFPHGARTHVSLRTDFLLELTNDGWFGEGSAQWQHLAAAVFRAVENGVPVVRCTNTGVTCWIDRHGIVRQMLEVEGRGVYGAGHLVCEIPLGQQRETTFYRERGDWFGWGCVVSAVWLGGRKWLVGKVKRGSEERETVQKEGDEKDLKA